MNNIEQKVLQLLKDCGGNVWEITRNGNAWVEALCRAIERHEAFRLEVSDAIVFALKVYGGHSGPLDPLRRFIITKPDPLVETLKDMKKDPTPYINSEIYAERLRAALAKRGLEIKEVANG